MKLYSMLKRFLKISKRKYTWKDILKELADLLSERDGRFVVLEERKQNYINKKMRAYKAEM